MSRTVLAQLERGKQYIYAERLGTLAHLLGASADYLFGLRETGDASGGTRRHRTRHRQPAPAAVDEEGASDGHDD